jgi:hypothetical protein
VIGFTPVLAFWFCRAVRQTLDVFVSNKEGNPMAANYAVKLDEGDKVKDLFSDDVNKYFNHKEGKDNGELTLKEDGSVMIAYIMKDDTVTFTVKKSPRLFSDGDWQGMLKDMFG